MRSRILRGLLTAALLGPACTSGAPASRPTVTLTILDNVDPSGVNAQKARWILDHVIPRFRSMMRTKGTDVEVRLHASGIDPEDYKTGAFLELQRADGPDVVSVDQFWIPEFVEAGALETLEASSDGESEQWGGWNQMSEAVLSGFVVDGSLYGVPFGTDGRVLFYNRALFRRARIEMPWRPRSWDDIITTAQRLEQRLPNVVPLQINAGTSMGEATTLQGFVPILLGTGAQLYYDRLGRWQGDTRPLRAALTFFQTIYSSGLSDPDLQLGPNARDRTFRLFSEGRIAVIAESDYLYRSVLDPHASGQFPMRGRDRLVAWARIPAQGPGRGIRGQDFVSASGGSGYVISGRSKHPRLAWELLQFMNSRAALADYQQREPRISARDDVNRGVTRDEPLLRFIARRVLPTTWFRPGFALYPLVSEEIAQMVESVATGAASVPEAAREFEEDLEVLVGRSKVVTEPVRNRGS